MSSLDCPDPRLRPGAQGIARVAVDDSQAQLIVTDASGSRTVANIPISAGNNKPVVTILQPPNGTIFDWGKALAYQLRTQLSPLPGVIVHDRGITQCGIVTFTVAGAACSITQNAPLNKAKPNLHTFDRGISTSGRGLRDPALPNARSQNHRPTR